MRIGEVIGSLTLNRVHPSLVGAMFRLVVPLTQENLRGGPAARGEPLVVVDELGAGQGSWIAISEGGEAAQPYLPDTKPVDAYNAAILDSVQLAPHATN